jgi:hypothetical protein
MKTSDPSVSIFIVDDEGEQNQFLRCQSEGPSPMFSISVR